MRIGIYTALLAKPAGHENNVSGHVQLPLNTIRLLVEAGHDVELITTTRPDGFTFPTMLPPDIPIHQVPDARTRQDLWSGDLTAGVNPISLLQQLMQIRRISRTRNFDIVHFFGFRNTAFVAAAARLVRLGDPIVLTLLSFSASPQGDRPMSVALSMLDGVATATAYATRELNKVGIEASVIRHGPIRDIVEGRSAGPGDRNRVLYWRDMSAENGADVCIKAFRELAPKYPGHRFDFAARKYFNEVGQITDLVDGHSNVNLHRFPYDDGPDLATLISEATVVILPFRQTTIDPQLAIAESLAAGVPVIASDITSISELIIPGSNGWLIPPGDASAIVSAVSEALDQPARTAEMGRDARTRLRAEWNWDSYVADVLDLYSAADRN